MVMNRTKHYIKDFAQEFELETNAPDHVYIDHCADIENQSKTSLLWAKSKEHLSKIKSGVVLTHSDLKDDVNDTCYAVYTNGNLRLTFARIVTKLFQNEIVNYKNHAHELEARKDVVIGPNCFIAEEVEIGRNCIIEPNVTIHRNTKIGDHCRIQSGATISTEGLGFEKDDNGQWIAFPQMGWTIIGNNVQVGPNATIRKAALGTTKIDDGTIVGGLCNIGHNCHIMENCILITSCVIGGSVHVGANTYIGINAVVKNALKIGREVTIGMGAVVINDIPDGQTVVGNPARIL